jgi:hypothetical protein
VAIETDPATPVGLMRLLAADLDEAAPLLDDDQYRALLVLEGGNAKRGAAAALETIATSETLLTKKITTQDLSIDGPAVAKDLRERAKGLREQADVEAPAGADEAAAFGFDWVDFGRRPWL